MQIEQFEVLLEMQGKFQKLGIANFQYFEVCCGIVPVLEAFFCEVVVQSSCCA